MSKDQQAHPANRRHFPARQALGIVALGSLACLGIVGSSWDALRLPAVVEAGRVFSLSVVEGGRIQWNLCEGGQPGRIALVRQLVQAYVGADRVELVLAPGITDGQTVKAGQEVATLRSIHLESRLVQQRAERTSLQAQRRLLLAGKRPEVVTEAERNLDVVRARRESTRAELDRQRSLAEAGLISAMELEKVEIADEVNRRQIELAAAAVAVARSAPRSEEVVDLDSRIQALDATLRETENLVAGTRVLAPIDGVIRSGTREVAFEILDLKTVYLAVSLPAYQRSRLKSGATVRFSPATAPDTRILGTLVGISEETAPVLGAPSVWASVRVDNSRGTLVAGMTGTAEIETSRSPLGYLTALGRSLFGARS